MRNKRNTGTGSSGSTNDPNTSGSTGTPSPSGAPGQSDYNDPMASTGSGGLDAARRYSGDESAGMAGSMGSTGGTEGTFGSQGSVAGRGSMGSTSGYGSTGATGAMGAGMSGDRGTLQQAKDKARDVASQVREDAAGAARTGYRNTANRTADTLGTVAQSLRSSTQQMHDQQQGEGVARYMERMSDQAQRFADYLRNAEPDQVIGEVQTFARRQPALFLGGAFMLGLLASRFLRASERDERSDMHGGGGRDSSWNTATPRHGDELSSSWATMGDRELSTPVVREPTTPATDQGLGTAGPIGMEGDFGSGMRNDLGPDVNDRPGGFAGPDTR